MASESFSGVIISTLSDSGESKKKYVEEVTVKTSYDPNGISITVQSGSHFVLNVIFVVKVSARDMCFAALNNCHLVSCSIT